MTTTIGPDGLRDDERAKPWDPSIAAPHCVCADCTVITLRARLIESRAETEAEKRAHAETRAERGRLRLDLDAYRTAREAFGKTVQGGARAHDAAAALMVERDRLRAALDGLVDSAHSLVAACEKDGLCPVCGANAMIENCAESCCVTPVWKRANAARALLGEVKP
jgi:hypothetical protein